LLIHFKLSSTNLYDKLENCTRASYFKKRWCLFAFNLPSDIFDKLCW
jgi:hypothetical protein